MLLFEYLLAGSSNSVMLHFRTQMRGGGRGQGQPAGPRRPLPSVPQMVAAALVVIFVAGTWMGRTPGIGGSGGGQASQGLPVGAASQVGGWQLEKPVAAAGSTPDAAGGARAAKPWAISGMLSVVSRMLPPRRWALRLSPLAVGSVWERLVALVAQTPPPRYHHRRQPPPPATAPMHGACMLDDSC
jgi:hypothetical protein